MDELDENKPQEQVNNKKKYQFKPGVSGNPGGRPKGSKSMKTWAKEYLAAMPEEDRVEFVNSIDHKTIWEMSEGKAKQDVEVEGEVNILIKIDE